MFEAFCEDIKLDKRNFDERYGKSFYEAIENCKASVSIEYHWSKKSIWNMLHVLQWAIFRANDVQIETWHRKPWDTFWIHFTHIIVQSWNGLPTGYQIWVIPYQSMVHSKFCIFTGFQGKLEGSITRKVHDLSSWDLRSFSFSPMQVC